MRFNYPPYIFGMHDPGNWMNDVQAARKQGWVLYTEEIRNNTAGHNYASDSNRGFGVLVRLNWGYDDNGTIPTQDKYPEFADRCKAWVNNSQGANVWIIGNEMNLAGERPGGPADANKITPTMYADCFRRCRDAIRSLPNHDDDLVVMGAVAPYNNQTAYPGNPSGDWVQYFADILNALEPNNVDGISLHAYTHGADPNLVVSDGKMDPPFNHRSFHFRTYRDFMQAIPAELKRLPVFITEAQPAPEGDGCNAGGWIPQQSGSWAAKAYQEINDWNNAQNNQPIQALLLFRWQPSCNAWSIEDKDWIRNGFIQTLSNDYKVIVPGAPLPPPPPPPVKTYRAMFLGDNTPPSIAADDEARITVTVQNDGTFVWRADGNSATPVRFGFRWFDANGNQVLTQTDARTPLPRDIQPGEQVTLTNARIIAPQNVGPLTLRLDMVEEGVAWFADRGSTARNKTVVVVRGGVVELPTFAYTVTNSNIPASFARNTATPCVLTIRNDGSKTWHAGGAHPVTLGFHWYRPNATQETLVAQPVRVAVPRDVATGDSVTLTIGVLAPFLPGAYNLLFEMVEEGVTEFRAASASSNEPLTPFVKPVTVSAPPYYVTWLNAPTPPSFFIDQTRNLTVSLRNDGGKTWAMGGNNPVRLAYNWYDRHNQRVLVKQDIRSFMPHDVAPGDAVDVSIDLLAPDRPGAMTLRFDLVEEGITFFGDQGSPPLDKEIAVLGTQEYQVTFGDLFTVAPRTQFTYTLRVRNDGTRIWAAGGSKPVHVGYHWFDLAGQPVPSAQDIRTSLPADLAPGDEAVVAAVGFSPDNAGRYRLQWSLVAEGIAWFYDVKGRTLDINVEVSPLGALALQTLPGHALSDAAYRATFTPTDALATMEANAQRTFTIKVRNDGTKTWVAGGANPVHAGYRWYQGADLVPVAQDIRTALPGDVSGSLDHAPGQEVTFGAQIVAPSLPDIYTLRFDLVEEGVTWFADTNTSRSLDLNVQVTKSTQAVRVQASHNDDDAPLMVNGNPTVA
ncbi:MAG: NBR1-Ig-like domain-containing protein, partial [Chloroflexota bacterium]